FVNEVKGNDGFAAAIAVLAIIITTIVFLVQKYIANKHSFEISALHPMVEKEPKKTWKVFLHFYSYLIVAIAILPQVYVTYTSFKNTSGKIFVPGYSLRSYETAFAKLGASIQNTIIIPLLALV